VQSSSQIITTNKPTSSFFTGQMPFLSPNQQRQSTEGKATTMEMKQQKSLHNKRSLKDNARHEQHDDCMVLYYITNIDQFQNKPE